MSHYVDGFVLPVPTENLAAYQTMAEKGAKIWLEHGALEYRECVADDTDVKFGVPFPAGISAQPGETIVFAWIVFQSREHRDEVNAKVMQDPRLCEGMDEMAMPFDCKRMLYGGFKTIVKA
jgi:uncharacterized protein YbaA (DUF1428 family)